MTIRLLADQMIPFPILIREPCTDEFRLIQYHQHVMDTLPYLCASVANMRVRIPSFTPFFIADELCALIMEYVVDSEFILQFDTGPHYPHYTTAVKHIKHQLRWVDHLLNIQEITLEDRLRWQRLYTFGITSEMIP